MDRILIIGGGGREHALAWKLSQSPLVEKIYAAPGNAGIAETEHCELINLNDFKGLADFAEKEKITLTIPGSETPLAEGIVDYWHERKLPERGFYILGPAKDAARLESSKIWAKEFMRRHEIPTAEFEVFPEDNFDVKKARKTCDDFIAQYGGVVVKKDGLAGGKGVKVCDKPKEAYQAIDDIVVKKRFGAKDNGLVLERKLDGVELSYIGITDGIRFISLATSQDHKRLKEGDQGENTGGMGAYSPVHFFSDNMDKKIMSDVILRVLEGMRREGMLYTGFLYAGLMITNRRSVKVLEFNCRMGDPEAQPIMARMQSDLYPHLLDAAKGNLGRRGNFEYTTDSAVCVVMASEGYPEKKGEKRIIRGLDQVQLRYPDVILFHGGTQKSLDGVLSGGGRELGVVALGPNVKAAKELANKAADFIRKSNPFLIYRRDIGDKSRQLENLVRIPSEKNDEVE